MNKTEKHLEIVFISSDQTEEKMKAYYAEQPWIAMPFNDEHKKKCIATLKPTGIPQLVVLNLYGVPVVMNGKKEVLEKGPQVMAEWVAKAKG